MRLNMLAKLQFLKVDQPSPSIRRISISIPETHNALNPQVVVELISEFSNALLDTEVLAIVLTGEDGNFCAGDQYSLLTTLTTEQISNCVRNNHTLARLLVSAPKPIISAVEGAANGGGVGLALLADYIVIGNATTFSFPYIQHGIMPDFGLLHSLMQRTSAAKARKLLTNDSLLSCDEIDTLGLVERVVTDEEVQASAVAIAIQLGKLPTGVFQNIKDSLRKRYTFEQELSNELHSRVMHASKHP